MGSKGRSAREVEGRGFRSLRLGASTRSLSDLSPGPKNRHLSGAVLELSLYEVMRAAGFEHLPVSEGGGLTASDDLMRWLYGPRWGSVSSDQTRTVDVGEFGFNTDRLSCQ